MSKENLGYTVTPPSKGAKAMNILAPIILAICFLGGVVYTSFNIGQKNDNYLEKVEQMKNDKEAKKEVVSENLLK